MRMNINAALVAASFASLSFAAFAAQPLLPASTGDRIPARLVSLPAPAGQFERAPMSFSWALDPAMPLSQPDSPVAESREYWQTVDGAELQAGVPLKTSAPGALIRISPSTGSAPVDAASVGISRNGRAARLEQAADAAALQAAGMDVATGTAVIRLAPENSAGTYSLRSPQARGRYVVHVFEPDSDVVLKAQADRHNIIGGETVTVAMELSHGGKPVAARAEGLLVAPDGSSRPMTVTRGKDGTLAARAKLPLQASATPGLWELQLFASGDGISREVRTAFGVSAPTARIGSEVEVSASRLQVSVPVESASPGRYEVRGTLYATASDGTLAPVSQAHSAAWFERGKGVLVLAFDRAHVPAGYGAPYEVRQLELNDQTRLAPLESRSRAARF